MMGKKGQINQKITCHAFKRQFALLWKQVDSTKEENKSSASKRIKAIHNGNNIKGELYK